MMTAEPITMQAYAKINLTIDVLRSRNDGFHEVAMIMQTVGLADTVEINPCDAGISVATDLVGLACDATNLAYRAAALLSARLRVSRGVHIHLKKRIPLAAGLAGGSSDAAAVLRGLNQLWSLGLTMPELEELGAELGSDVPFCLQGGTMLATGRGEKLTRLPDLPPSWLVLVKPRVAVSTAWVYGQYRCQENRRHPDTAGMISCLQHGDRAGIAARLGNVLETVTIPAHPEIGVIKQYLQQQGAMAALMSGSGPTVFGIMADRSQAEQAAAAISKQVVAEIMVTNTVAEVERENGTAIIAD